MIISKTSRGTDSKPVFKHSIRTILIALFLLQVLVITFITTYLSLKNNAKSVNVLVDESIKTLNLRIKEQINTYFKPPVEINNLNESLIKQKLLDANDQAQLMKQFNLEIQARKSVNSIYFANPRGGIANAGIDKIEGRNYVIYTEKFQSGLFNKYEVNENCLKTDLITQVPFFDARTRPWFQKALQDREVVWSDVYILATGNDLGVSASKAVRDPNNQLIGVVGVDLFLSDISKFLAGMDIGKSGQVFIMDKTGLLIASSKKDKLFNVDNKNQISSRINALDSKSGIIKTVSNSLKSKYGDINKISREVNLDIKVNNKSCILNVTPFMALPSHEWFIVTVIPQSDFMAQVYANNKVTIFLIIVALLLSIALAVFLARLISKPILSLDKRVKGITTGDWSSEPIPSKILEIDGLATEIYKMKNTIQSTIGNLNSEIKERELAEATLWESQKRLYKTQEIAHLGSWEIDMNTGELLWSEEVYRICEVEPQEFKVSYNAFVDLIHPEDRENVDKAYRDSVRDGKDSYEIEHRLIRKQTGEIRYVFEKCEHLKDETGKIIRSVGMIIDITEQKQAETLLQDIIDKNPISIQILDKDGFTIKVNASNIELFGLAPPPDFCMFNDTQIMAQGQAELLQRARNGEVVHLPDMYYNVHDFSPQFPDKPIWVKVVIFPLMGKNGKPERFVLMHEDVTHRKAAEKALIAAKESAEESNRLKTSFLANMSHELRTPLSGILGFSELLSSKLHDKDSLEIVEMIHESGNRLLNTLNLILDLSRIEANKQDVHLSTFDLNKLLGTCVKLFVPVADQKGLKLEFAQADSIQCIHSDCSMIEHIINELVGNAIKYTDEGSVTVSVKTVNKDTKTQLEIEVCDTGIGIPLDQQEAIFDAFRQVSEGWSRSYEGTGLGLTICKNYTGLLGGDIRVESELGKGSRFIISFPTDILQIETPEVETKAAADVVLPEPVPVRTEALLPRILLVDDDEMCHYLTAHMISNIAELDYSATGEEGVNKLLSFKYAAVLLDINLKRGLSGFDVLNEIKKMENYSDVPVIAITAYAMVGDREVFLSQGFTDYISKPFSGSKLSSVLGKWLRK